MRHYVEVYPFQSAAGDHLTEGPYRWRWMARAVAWVWLWRRGTEAVFVSSVKE